MTALTPQYASSRLLGELGGAGKNQRIQASSAYQEYGGNPRMK